MTPDPTPPADAAPPAPRSAMLVAFVVTFIDLLGFGIVLPLLPLIAKQYLPHDRYDDAERGVVIGALFSVFSLMQFVFSPMWGRISDRVGRRPVLLVGLAGSVVFYALFGYASSLPAAQATLALVLLMASRVGAGIAGATVSTAAAVIADCTPPEKRAKGMALIGAAFGIGFTFGPLIAWAGSAAFAGNPWGPGAAAAALSAVALLVALFVMPETLRPGPKPPRYLFSLERTREVLRTPTVGALVLIYFLAIFAFANFEGTLALFVGDAFPVAGAFDLGAAPPEVEAERDRAAQQRNYLIFAYVGFVLMLVQGGIYRPLTKRMSEPRLLAVGLGLMLLGLAGLALTAWGTYGLRGTSGVFELKRVFYPAITAAVAGFAFVNPSVAGLVSKRSDPARQGEVLGVNQSFAALARILGPLVGNVAFGLHASRIAPYALAAVVLVGVVALLPKVKGTEQK